MGTILFLAILLILGSGFSYVFHKKIEETIPLAAFSIISVLYISGLAAGLLPGLYLICLGALILLVFLAVRVRADGEEMRKNFFTWGLAAFLLYFALFYWSTRGRLLSSWDEFSHWGLVVKNMYLFDDFGNVEGSTVLFKGYPPASALFEYFYTRLSGRFYESHIIHAMDILLISLLLPCFEHIKNGKQGFWPFIELFFICLGIPIVFNGNIYQEIYVDILLGLLFAYILYHYYKDDNENFKIVTLSMALFVLSLTKASGTGLAVIAVLVMAVDVFLKKNTKGARRKTGYLLILLLSILLGKYSWDLYIKLTHTGDAWNTSQITWENVRMFFTRDNPEYRVETLKNFLEGFFTKRFSGYIVNLSTALWLSVFGLLAAVYRYLAEKEEKLQGRHAAAVLKWGTGCIAVYIFSLLVLYLFTYSEYEAVALASFERYLSTYLTGILSLFIFVFIHDFSGRYRRLYGCVLLFLLFNVNFHPLSRLLVTAPYEAAATGEAREPYAAVGRLPEILDPKESKVFFISQNDKGLDYYTSRYCATPVELSNTGLWSLGKPYYEGDIWTRDMDSEGWKNLLRDQGYTHVYLHHVDQQFTDLFQSLFQNPPDIQDNALFRIDERGELIRQEY